MNDLKGQRVLVTGATGFLGGAVARSLRSAGASVLAHGRSPAGGDALRAEGFDVWLAPLEDAAAVAQQFQVDPPQLVVHSAALSAPFGPRDAFVRSNVDATGHLLAASERSQVQRFVHISTPAIYSAGRSLHAVREDAELPPRAINHYAETKRLGEELVRAAHGRGLPAVILRPRAIYGPGDRALFPRLLRALEEGRLPIIGNGRNRIDLTYIDDAVHGVQQALTADARCLGRAYNLTGPEPAALWDVIAQLADALQLPRPTRRVPYPVARAVAAASESWHRWLRRPGEPRLTRYSVDSLALDASLDISAARADLQYEPQVGVAEGVQRFLASLDADRESGKEEPR